MLATLAVHERAMNNIIDCSSWIRTLSHLTMFVLGCVGGGVIQFFTRSSTSFSAVESAWTDELFAGLETLIIGSIMLLLGVLLCLSIWALWSSIADTRPFHALSSSRVLVPLVSTMCFFLPSMWVVQCLADGGDLVTGVEGAVQTDTTIGTRFTGRTALSKRTCSLRRKMSAPLPKLVCRQKLSLSMTPSLVSQT